MYVQCNHFCCRLAPFTWICESKTRERKWTMKLHILWNELGVFSFFIVCSVQFFFMLLTLLRTCRGWRLYISPFFHFWGALFVLIRLCILLLLLFLSDNIEKWLAILFVLLHAYRQSSLSCLKGSRHQDIFFNRKETWISCSISIWWAVVCLIFIHSISFKPQPSNHPPCYYSRLHLSIHSIAQQEIDVTTITARFNSISHCSKVCESKLDVVDTWFGVYLLVLVSVTRV